MSTNDAPDLFNCWLWAKLEYRRRCRAWVAAGRPFNKAPYILKRPTYFTPQWFSHWFVGEHDPSIDAVHVESYTPINPTNDPWWAAWRHVLFRGKVKRGDTHYGDL
jgi:hypothetical protein